MTVEQRALFSATAASSSKSVIDPLDVGLGYVRLCQSSTTLAGFEAPAIKLRPNIMWGGSLMGGKTLYILDSQRLVFNFEDIKASSSPCSITRLQGTRC